MTGIQQLDSAGARIVDRLHASIATLVHGNHVDRSELVQADRRSCRCHLIYEVDWSFVSYASQSRVRGDASVSTHYGYDREGYDDETVHRREIGRTHAPIRANFMSQVLDSGGAALADAGDSCQIWDFGQHSVHARCGPCRGNGRVACHSCHGNGRESCFGCSGHGSTTQTRWVHGHNGHGRHESYQQTCHVCGGSGRVSCRQCHGSGDEQCSDCAGHGFFTDIMSVTVQAEPRVRITTRSALSRGALSDYLVQLPVAKVVRFLDFTQFDHQDAAEDIWRVCYEADTIVVELDLTLRGRTFMAAAVGDKALAFVRPPIFDDLFIDEIAALSSISANGKASLSHGLARRFFDAYSKQPALDATMKAVAKLKGREREFHASEVTAACDGYISTRSANLLGQCMIALLDKVSPPNSPSAWVGVMALPTLVLFLGAQNWLERNAPDGYFALGIVWILLAFTACLLTIVMSPLAACISAAVSATRRRAVPCAYRQHGRNWQPFKPFLLASVFAASLGGALGLASHHDFVPRWNNAPLDAIEEKLDLNRFEPYARTAALLKQAGFFLSPATERPEMPSADAGVMDIQSNLKRLGYKVPVTGQMDDATRRTIAAYAKKRKLASTEQHVVLTSLCKDLRGLCTDVSQIKSP